MVDDQKNKEPRLQSCSQCDGNGSIDGHVCPACAGAGLWLECRGAFFYADLPQAIRFSARYQASLLAGKISISFLISLVVFGMISIVRNIGYNIDIAHEYWYDFHHAGFWGLFSYLGLFASLVLLYWVVRGKEPAACLSVAQVLPHAITDTPMTWEQIRTTVPRQNIIDISKYLSYSARCLVEDALTTAERRNHRYFLPEHLVMAIFSSSLSRELQVRLDIAGKSLLNRLFSYTDNLEKRTQDTVQISKALKSALLYAAWEAIGLDTIYVNRKTLLLGAMRASQAVTDAFIEYDVHIDEVRHVVYWLDVQKEKREWWKDLTIKKFQRTGKLDRGWLGGWTLTLNKHSKDLTKAAKKGYLRRVVGREGEVEEIARILSRSTKNNALLIGEPGVGKTTLIDGLAYKIVSGQVPETLRDKRLVELNIGSVVGSAENPNQFGETMVKILAEVEKSKNVILFIPYLHTLKGAGSSNGGALDAFGILEPAFNRCAFQCIGTTTFRDYHRYIESSESFGRFFERVEIKEPDFNNTIKILEEVVLAFEAKQKVKVAYQALKAAYVLGNKYIHDKVMPDKAVDLLDEACVLVSRRKKGKRLVTESDIADVIASKTNIPVRDISTDETDKLLRLEEIMRERVIGQEEAVSAVAEAVRRARVGLKDSNRPVATFLFVGPTGVGKTELAKTLAEAYFGHEKIMVRLDMSEFHGPESIDRLIGAPPGRAGSETGGQLTEAIKKRPFSLVLLDEFEKAHSDVHNVFLQVFDDGRLTDSSGKLVDFTNSIIIATSNAGAKMIQDGILQNRRIEDIRSDLFNKVLPSVFRPELINRFDGVIVFKPLTYEQVHRIAEKILASIRSKLRAQDIQMKITREAVEKLSKLGFDSVYGARPLRRIISEKVENPIAGKILRAEINKGDTVIIRECDI